MYLYRTIEPILKKSIQEFPVVALMGPRQVGKSTVLKHCFAEGYEYLTFDDFSLRSLAKSDPALFIRNHPGRLILDEIQYVPELLPEIKMAVDSGAKPGRFILTGSQQYNLIRGMKETLAGRVLLLDLPPMTLDERLGRGVTEHWAVSLVRGASPTELRGAFAPEMSPLELVFRGGLPGLIGKSHEFIPAFFESYLATYLERDLPSQYDLKDAAALSRFMRLLAALSSREVNKSQLGREIGISPPTADRWLSWLRASLVWREHESYHGNYIKRISRHSKGFLFDTGLACGLLHIATAQALESHPMLGSLFEAAMRIEVEAAIRNCLLPARCHHWKTPYGHEVDIVIEYENRLFALECKWGSHVDGRDAGSLRFFKKQYGDSVAVMGVLTPFGRFGLIDRDIMQIPWLARA